MSVGVRVSSYGKQMNRQSTYRSTAKPPRIDGLGLAMCAETTPHLYNKCLNPREAIFLSGGRPFGRIRAQRARVGNVYHRTASAVICSVASAFTFGLQVT